MQPDDSMIQSRPRTTGAWCLLLALLALGSMRAAPVSYGLREQEAHDLTLTVKPDGTADVETTGTEPSLVFEPKGSVDAKNQFVLAFDYFCPEGVPNLSVFYGEPWSDERAVLGLALPKAEVFQPFRVNLARLSSGEVRGLKAASVSGSDWGNVPRLRIQIRNVRIDVATEDDLKSPEQLWAERERRLAQDRAVSDYLGAVFPFNDAAARLEGDDIHFTARLTGQFQETDKLYLAQFPIWSSPWLLMRVNAPGDG